MSLLNIISVKSDFRPKTDSDQDFIDGIRSIQASHKHIASFFKKGLQLVSHNASDLKVQYDSQTQSDANTCLISRYDLLDENMRLSQEVINTVGFNGNHFFKTIDIPSVISSYPRTPIDELKETADKLGFCILDERIFAETNSAPNAEMANDTAEFLKDKGYSIYYLSPISGFDFSKMLTKGQDIYDIDSYWGVHDSTFNSLALTVNVFQDLYRQIELLKRENKEIKKLLESEQSRVKSLHQQFKRYVEHSRRTLRVIESPLNQLIDDKNGDVARRFYDYRDFCLRQNATYKYKPMTTHSYHVWIDKESGQVFSFLPDRELRAEQYRIEQRTRTVNNILPVPESPEYYQHFFNQFFEVEDLAESQKAQVFSQHYNLVNIKKLIKSQLGNNYLMIAVKGTISEPSDTDALVLSCWGEGISKETIAALDLELGDAA